MTAKDAARIVQGGLGVSPDGRIGKATTAAFEALKTASPDSTWPPVAPPVPISGDPVDRRSEANISTLNPAIQPLARALIRQAAAQGIAVKVTSGYRSYEEQAELRRKYEAGGPKAARPGYSNHNYALAFDVTLFKEDGTTPIWESPNYTVVGAIGKKLGLFWGGDWQGKDEDQPHYELRPQWAGNLDETSMIAELRRRSSSGQSLLA